jgi:nitroreductase
MDLLEGIMTTRSIRRFKDESVSDEEIETCLRAAAQAPNGGNIQPWQFLVITDVEQKTRVGEVYKKSWDRYLPAVLKAMPPPRSAQAELSTRRTISASQHLADHIGKAPALVAFLVPKISMTLEDESGPMDTGTIYASVFPAVQNFMLAARSLGIGTTLTTVFRIYQDELKEILEIPEQYDVVALVPMGRPRGSFGVAQRRAAETLTHWNTFGNKTHPA